MKTATTKKTSQSTLDKLVNGITKSFQNSLRELVSQMGPSTEFRKLKTAKIKAEKSRGKSMRESEMFLETLKHIGRPAITREIAIRYKKLHPTAVPKNKARFMQKLYNSASYLSKEGVIQRHAVGGRSYEYSLKPDKAAKTETKSAA